MKRALPAALLLLTFAGAACGGSASEPQPTPVSGATASPTALTLPPDRSHDPAPLAKPDPALRFDHRTLELPSNVGLKDPSSLAFGPDGRLYVSQVNGRILALTLDGFTVTNVETIATTAELQDVLGIAFNPSDSPAPLTLYITQTSVFAGGDAPPYPSKVSKLVAPDFTPVDIITGLPVSPREHATNGLAFDGQGRLYIAQGSATNAGVTGAQGRSESPLSGAVLVADIDDPAFDGAIQYDPPGPPSVTTEQVSGDVRVFASGFRNPYDLVVHSNGRIYATDNGPNRSPIQALDCETDGPPDPTAPDELNLVLDGHYYGHANRNRGRSDPRQCTYAIPLDASAGATPPIALLGYSTSADGLVEYTADAFGGRMRGDLIYVEWAQGRVWRVQLSSDGTSVVAISRFSPDVLQRPLDVTVGPDGTVYVVENGAGRISYFIPVQPEPDVRSASDTP
ncbi:MAG: PQQ-dependent sugar dehydrogenase [Dehalococcoidia bacterium]